MDTSNPSSDVDERWRRAAVRIWCVIGAAIIFMIVLRLLGVLSGALLFLAVGCFTAFVATPIVNWLQKRGMPRPGASILAILFVLVVVVLVFSLLIPMVTGQIIELLSGLPAKIARFGSVFNDIEQRFTILQHLGEYIDTASIVSSLQSASSQIASGLLGAVRDGVVPMVNNVASTLFIVFLGFVLAYWVACDYPTINNEICRLLGGKRAVDYRLMTAVVSSSVGGYLRSMVINSCIQGLLAFIGFTIVGLPYAATMGVLSGVLNFIPVVGPSISAAIAVFVALFTSPVMAIWTLVVAVLAQNVTDNVIAPRINQSTMQVHPALSLTALVIGSVLAGTLGMVIAIPMCAVIKSLFIFYYEEITGRQIVAYDGALFRGTPYSDAEGRPVPAFDALGDDRFSVDSEIMGDVTMPKATAAPRPVAPARRNPMTLLRGDARRRLGRSRRRRHEGGGSDGDEADRRK